MGKLIQADIPGGLILALNSGSSSLKVGFFRSEDGDERSILTGTADNIGHEGGRIRLTGSDGVLLLEQKHAAQSQKEAFAKLVEASRRHIPDAPAVIGHRIVHGGPELTQHQPVTSALKATLEEAIHFAPLHIPVA